MESSANAMVRQMLQGLACDLRRNHANDADHLEHVIALDTDPMESLMNPDSKLWGAIPIEILEETSEGRRYLNIIDTFIKNENQLRSLGSAAEVPVCEVSGFIADILKMDVFANVNPLELLSNPTKFQEFAENVQKVVDDGTIDVNRLEIEVQTLMAGAPTEVTEQMNAFNALIGGQECPFPAASGESNATAIPINKVIDTVD